MATATMLQDGSDLIQRILAESEIAPFAPGYVLANRWKIIERIGKGGFGFVYSARDTELEGKVAIKVLRPEHETSPETIQQFKQEIQLARQVTHQNVCRIYDVGFHAQGDLRVPFLSMELLDGQPLDQRLRDHGALPLAEVELITRQVASALDAAHGAGIVHADLKPANIMLVGSGSGMRAVVTDFGLASAHASVVHNEDAQRVVGTPAYMAPEQVEGKRLGPAADFYALGCTLYQLLSGKLPFVADTPVATARSRLSVSPPKLSDLDASIPTVWVNLVHDLMARDPEQRLASGTELGRRLRSSRATILVGVALLSVLLAGLFFGWQAGDTTKEYGSFELSLPEDPQTRAVYDQGLAHWEAFRVQDAVATWQAGIAAGHQHPRLYLRLCAGLSHLNKAKEFTQCTEDAFQSSKKIGGDEQNFYEAFHRHYTGQHVRAAELALQLLDHYPGNVEVVRLLAGVQRSQLEYTHALNTLKQARIQSEADRVALKTAECKVLIEFKHYDEAIALALEFLPRARELGMQREVLSLLDALAQSTRNSGQLDRSKAYAEQSLELAQRLQSDLYEAQANSLLTAVAIQQRRYSRAMELVDRRTAGLFKSGDTRAAYQMLITKAEILVAAGMPKEALKVISEQALPHLREDGNTYWHGYALVIRSQIRLSLGQPEAALDDCFAGEAVFLAIRSERLPAFAQITCAAAMLDTGRLKEARSLLTKARESRTKLGLTLLLLQNSMLEAEVLLADGMSDLAVAQAEVVANDYKERGLPSYEAAARELLARAALALADEKRAREAIERAIELGAGEERELDLQVRLVSLRLRALRSEGSEARAGIEALQAEARELGYERIAKMAGEALSAGSPGSPAN